MIKQLAQEGLLAIGFAAGWAFSVQQTAECGEAVEAEDAFAFVELEMKVEGVDPFDTELGDRSEDVERDVRRVEVAVIRCIQVVVTLTGEVTASNFRQERAEVHQHLVEGYLCY